MLIRAYFRRSGTQGSRERACKCWADRVPDRRRAGGPGPDVVRTLQAQDLQRHHRLRRGREDRADQEPLFDLHQGVDRSHPQGKGRRRLLPVGLQGQRGRDPLLAGLEPGRQGRDAQQPVGAGPLRRGADRHRRRQPRPVRDGDGRQADLQHGRLLLRDTLLGQTAPAQPAPPAPDLRGRSRRGRTRRQQVGHPDGQRLAGLRRSLRGQAAGLLRHRRDHAGEAPRQTLGGQDRATGRPDRDDRRADRQGRHPRRDVLVRGASRGIAGDGGADRRPDHAEADDRLPARRARPRALRLHHRQRRGRALVVGRRDGAVLRRRRHRAGRRAAQVRRARPVGDPDLRGAGADDAGRGAGEARRVRPARRGLRRRGDGPGELHRLGRVPRHLRGKDRLPHRPGFPARRPAGDEPGRALGASAPSRADGPDVGRPDGAGRTASRLAQHLQQGIGRPPVRPRGPGGQRGQAAGRREGRRTVRRGGDPADPGFDGSRRRRQRNLPEVLRHRHLRHDGKRHRRGGAKRRGGGRGRGLHGGAGQLLLVRSGQERVHAGRRVQARPARAREPRALRRLRRLRRAVHLRQRQHEERLQTPAT